MNMEQAKKLYNSLKFDYDVKLIKGERLKHKVIVTIDAPLLLNADIENLFPGDRCLNGYYYYKSLQINNDGNIEVEYW